MNLTRREFEVYMLIVERAWSDKRIAESLGISDVTVNIHLNHIMDKLGMSSRLELLSQYHRREQHP